MCQPVQQAISNVRDLVRQRPSETNRLGRWPRSRWRRPRRRGEPSRPSRRVRRLLVRLLRVRVRREPAVETLSSWVTWWHRTRTRHLWRLGLLRRLRRLSVGAIRTRNGARPSARWTLLWGLVTFLQFVLLFLVLPVLVLPVLVVGRARAGCGLLGPGLRPGLRPGRTGCVR